MPRGFKEPSRKNPSIGNDHHDIQLQGLDELRKIAATHLHGLTQGQTQFPGALRHSRGAKLSTPPSWLIRLGDDQDDLTKLGSLDQSVQAVNRETRRTEKGDAEWPA